MMPPMFFKVYDWKKLALNADIHPPVGWSTVIAPMAGTYRVTIERQSDCWEFVTALVWHDRMN